uniref:CSON001714 protein n=1 Tax=Culicoides sonorensis TaxID=179676 RepID=A0A336KXE7_CULSO
MVYIGRDGTIAENQPWSLNRLWGMILGFFNAIYFFFATLFSDLVPNKNESTRRPPRSGGGGSGPSGGSGGTGRGQPAGFGRRIGRVVNMDDCNIPGGG